MSGIGGSEAESGSIGANETALASMRCGNSNNTVVYCRFGKSGDIGDAQPLCVISPQTGCGGGIMTTSGRFSGFVDRFRRSPDLIGAAMGDWATKSGAPGPDTTVGGCEETRGRESHAMAALLLKLATIIFLTFLLTSPFSTGIHVFGMAARTVRFV